MMWRAGNESGNQDRAADRLPSAAMALCLLWAGGQALAGADPGPATRPTEVAAAGLIQVDGRDLQQVIDAAAPNSSVQCDPNQQLTRSAPLRIDKPLTLRGLNARLPAKLGNTTLVVVTAPGVTVSDFVLTGNGDTVSQDDRAALMIVGASDFRIERGRFVNSSKDGVMIRGGVVDQNDIVGGVVRDIVGQDVIRDTVAITGSEGEQDTTRIRNVLVENIRCYGSRKRGCVEVSDGAENITVRKVYAESSVYAVDVQDHRRPTQMNRDVLLEDIHALRCRYALRTDNIPLGHARLTVRDITAIECEEPIQISNTDNLSLCGARIIDHASSRKSPLVSITNCHGVVIRDVTVENTDHKGPAVLLEDCDGAHVDGVMVRGRHENLRAALSFRLTTERDYSGLRISNVFAPDMLAGIVLESTGEKTGTLDNYIISGNLARVQDSFRGRHALVSNNLP
ncbi:MAG: hypothetical protein AMXMBFR13_10170 [Phycisphaerae bacterium]